MKNKLSDYGINGDDNSKEYSNPKTTVEWLWDKLYKGEFINDPQELLEQAKEMEKEQIKKYNYYKKYWEVRNLKKTCYHPLTERKYTSDIHFECTICGYNNY